MHILLIHQAFAGLDEAGGTRHIEIARQLAEAGHKITIIASTVSYLTGKSETRKFCLYTCEHPEPGIEIRRSYAFSSIHRSFFHRLVGFLSFMISSFFAGLGVKHVDLIWGTSPPIFQATTAWALSKIKGVPFLFEVRDLWPAFAVAIGVVKNRVLIAASEALERFLYRQADCVMVNSPGFIQHVKERGAKRIELVPNAVDPTMFNTRIDGTGFRQSHDLIGKFVVLYAGAHGISNDLDLILQAAVQLKADNSIRFVFVGDGKEKNRLISFARDLKLDNVLFLPPIPKNEIAAGFAAADACVAILKPLEMYKTTYPNKVFDYMAAGKPVLLVIDGVIRRVIEDARSGLYIPPGDATGLANAIKQLAGDPSQGVQMGLNGRKYVLQHFDRRQHTASLILILESLRRKRDGKNINC